MFRHPCHAVVVKYGPLFSSLWAGPDSQTFFLLGYRMYSLLFLHLLCFFLALSRALGISDFSLFLGDDPVEDIFANDQSFGDLSSWDGPFDNDVLNPSPLLVSDCSSFSPLGRKRARRGNSPDICNTVTPLTGSAAGGEKKSGNENENMIGSEIHVEEELKLPSLAPYFNQKHDDCFRLSDGRLPIAVCDLNNSGASPSYMIDGIPYWDLQFSYPSKETLCFWFLTPSVPIPFLPPPTRPKIDNEPRVLQKIFTCALCVT